MKQNKHSQQGFFVTALMAVLVVVAFIFVLGYSTYYSKREQLTLTQNQKAYVYEVKARMLEAYATHALDIDADMTQSSYRTADVWLAMAGAYKKWGMEVEVSQPLAKDGVKYTSVTIWLPADTDSTNPPIYDPASGVFTSCTAAPCPDRVFTTFDGYGIQLAAYNKTRVQLNAMATKASLYFKARLLNDVVRDISVNYFRAGRGNCGTVGANDIPCISGYTAVESTVVPKLTGMDSQQMTNAWGLPFEVSNETDSNFASPPYTMSFRTKNPWGGYYSILAIENL